MSVPGWTTTSTTPSTSPVGRCTLVGTPQDAIAKLGELVDASHGGIGAFLFWGQEWTTPDARCRSYGLLAVQVMPVFQRS